MDARPCELGAHGEREQCAGGDGDEREQEIVDAEGAVVCGEDALQERWTGAAGGPEVSLIAQPVFARAASHAS